MEQLEKIARDAYIISGGKYGFAELVAGIQKFGKVEPYIRSGAMTEIFVGEEPITVDVGTLELNDPPRLVWVGAQEAVALIWRDNKKLHDMQQMVASIQKYGFQEPAKVDINLPRVGQGYNEDAAGAIKSGNGRVAAVAWMERHQVERQGSLPQGLAVDSDGKWYLPMLVGTDADSLVVAQGYAVDANNLVLAGGDYDAFDMSRMWGPGYVDLIRGMETLPVTVDADTLEVPSSVSVIGIEVDPDVKRDNANMNKVGDGSGPYILFEFGEIKVALAREYYDGLCEYLDRTDHDSIADGIQALMEAGWNA